MGLFGPSPEEEKKDIVEDILDLYGDMNGKSLEELKKSHCGYERAYKKILHSLENYYNRDILGSGVPQFLEELIQEIEDPSLVMGSTTIKRIEMGIRKITRKLNMELPEKRHELNEERKTIPNIIFNANQVQSSEINITSDIKVEVNQAIKNFEEEINKPNPNPSKLKILFDTIKKGAGYGAIKAVEILLKKYYGL